MNSGNKERFHDMFENAAKRGGCKNLSEFAKVANYSKSKIYRMASWDRPADIDKVFIILIRGKEGFQPGFASEEEVYQFLELIEPEVDEKTMENLRKKVKDELERLNLPAQSTEILFRIKDLYRAVDEQERHLQAIRQKLKELEDLL